MIRVKCCCCGAMYDELEPCEQPEGYLESLEEIEDDEPEFYCPQCSEDIRAFFKTDEN